MRSPDKYTGTSDSDSSEEERGRSAQEVHSPLMHTVEYASVPMPPERPVVRLNLGDTVKLNDDTITLFDREKSADTSKHESDSDTDEEDEDEEGQQSRQARRTVPPASTAPPAQSPPAEHTEHQWPTEEQHAEIVAALEAQEAEQHQAEHAPTDSHEAGQHMHGTEYSGTEGASTFDTPAEPLERPAVQNRPIAGHTVSRPVPRPAETYQWPVHDTEATRPIPIPPRPPVPPPSHGSGNLPPLPPTDRPLSGAESGGYSSPNTPQPAHFDAAPQHSYDRPVTVSHNYNVYPEPAYYRGMDTLARLGVVGNFIGNRRTRKKLGKKIDQNRREANANFADIQAQQQRAEHQQRMQSRELHNLQQVQQARAEAVPQPTPAAMERPVPAFLTAAEMPRVPRADSLPPIGRTPSVPSEKQPILSAERLVAPAQMTEQQQAEQLQAIELSPNEHVKQSSWHNIVVDERGREVEGAMHYGEEFRRERQREIMRDRSADGAAAATVSLGGTAVGSQTPYGQSQHYGGGLPSGMTSPTPAPGTPAPADPQHQMSSKTRRDGAVPGPIFWVMLAVIVAAFLAAALI